MQATEQGSLQMLVKTNTDGADCRGDIGWHFIPWFGTTDSSSNMSFFKWKRPLSYPSPYTCSSMAVYLFVMSCVYKVFVWVNVARLAQEHRPLPSLVSSSVIGHSLTKR